jgi:O-6-methylguanine DNA methyltransferase
MRCEEVSRRLDAFRTGELRSRESEEVVAHLSECRACEVDLQGIEEIAADLLRLQVRAPSGILQRVKKENSGRYAAVQTALGIVWVACNARGITRIDPSGGDPASFEEICEKHLGHRPVKGEMPPAYANAIRKAASGQSPSTVRVDLSGLTTFEQTVLKLLRQIPRGEVRPYGWLAREAGNPAAVRAVGNAMAHNPVPLLLPCHRVVPSAGGIGKYAFGTPLKRTLLMKEGAPVSEMERYAGEGVRFIGCRSTGIYCFPTCRDARRVRQKNRILLASAAAAAEAGFRPCRHCRP